jgi:hypothetical protein
LCSEHAVERERDKNKPTNPARGYKKSMNDLNAAIIILAERFSVEKIKTAAANRGLSCTLF